MGNVPELDIDKILGRPNAHGRLERETVFNLLSTLEKSGFSAIAIDDREEITKVSTIKDAMELVFNLDESIVVLKKNKVTHRIGLIMGNNEVCDMIFDWTYSDGDPDGFNSLMEEFTDSLE